MESWSVPQDKSAGRAPVPSLAPTAGAGAAGSPRAAGTGREATAFNPRHADGVADHPSRTEVGIRRAPSDCAGAAAIATNRNIPAKHPVHHGGGENHASQ